MKTFSKILCLVLALLMAAVCFAACGDKPAETTAAGTEGTETTKDDTLWDKVPTDLTYKDLPEAERTVTFFIRNTNDNFLNEICSEEPAGDILYEAIHYRNIDVENRFGITIKQIAAPGSELVSTEWQGWNSTLSGSVLNNTHEFDAALFHSYCASSLASQNIYMNLLTVDTESGNGYIDLKMPWWNQAAVNEMTYCGALFYVGGDICLTEIEQTFAIFFNKDRFNEFFPDDDFNNLYKMVDSKQWTIDKLVDYSNQCYRDGFAPGFEANGEKDDGDFFGFVSSTTPTTSCWVYAMGLKLSSRDEYGEMKLSILEDPTMIAKFEAVRGFWQGEGAYVYATKPVESTFAKGNQMFSFGNMNTGRNMRETSINYGLVPLPLYNEEQEEYHTGTVGNSSMFALLSNLDADRAKMMTAIVEVIGAKTHNEVLPVYYNTVLQGLYSKDEPDANMYMKVLSTVEMDFAYSLFPKNSKMSAYSGLWKVAKEEYDIAQTIDSNRTKWEEGLEEVMTALEEAADKSLGY